jgi:glutathione S-transferase
MLTVHHLNNSRSQRVLWLLEELGVPYEIVRYQRQPDMRAPAELRAIHPLGKSPVITDGGNTIAESGVIAEYIIDTYGEGRLIPPPKTPERLRYTYWLHYAEGSAMPPLLLKLLFTLMPKRAPALLRPLVRKVSNQALTALVNPQLKQHMAFWESELGKNEWFAGHEFTTADIQMISARSRRRAWRTRPGAPQGDGVPGPHSRPPGLSARVGKGRTVHGGALTAKFDYFTRV